MTLRYLFVKARVLGVEWRVCVVSFLGVFHVFHGRLSSQDRDLWTPFLRCFLLLYHQLDYDKPLETAAFLIISRR